MNENEVKANILKQFGEICSANACASCPLGVFGLSCSDVLRMHTAEAISIIESESGNNSYLAEYRRRFPFNKASDQDICFGICRKEVFEGAVNMQVQCPTKNCLACWGTERVDDIEDSDSYLGDIE